MKEKIIKFLEERISLGNELIAILSSIEAKTLIVSGIAALSLTKEFVESLEDES